MGTAITTPFQLTRRGREGFTFVEILCAASMLAMVVCTAVVALTQINGWAAGARLRTLALAVAQQRLDQLQTVPWQDATSRPSVLAAGTVTENSLPLNNDSFNSASGLSSAVTSLATPVTATRTTQITDLTPRTLRAVVTVAFTYRNRPYSVSLTSLRASDSI